MEGNEGLDEKIKLTRTFLARSESLEVFNFSSTARLFSLANNIITTRWLSTLLHWKSVVFEKSFPAGNFLANITSAQGALPLIPYKLDPQFIFPCTILNVPMYNRLFIFPPSRDIAS